MNAMQMCLYVPTLSAGHHGLAQVGLSLRLTRSATVPIGDLSWAMRR